MSTVSRRNFLHTTALASCFAPLVQRASVPAATGDLAFVPLNELSQLLKQKKLSPVEVTQAILGRIETLNPRLNAFITVTSELALEQAHIAEREITAGKWKGPLHGVPYSAKDIFATRGIRTTNGSKATANNVPAQNAAAIARLERAGAVLVGKTNLSEFASSSPSAFGESVNPWHRDYGPGGSSSGSGVAVAAGLSYFSLGTDTGGSIRDPANACGILGFKPTFGAIDIAGVTPHSPTFDHVGLLTRSAIDVAPVFDEVASTRVGTVSAGVRGLRIGVLDDDRDRATAEFEKALSQALQVLRDQGATIESGLRLKHFDSIPALRVIPAAELSALYAPMLAESMPVVGAPLRRLIEEGTKRQAAEYIRAQWTRTQAMEEVDALFGRFDALLSVGSAGPARPIVPRPRTPGTPPWRFSGFYASAVGIPACQFPIGLSAENELPFGMWVYGRRGHDGTVLRVAAAYQRATTWHLRRPPL